MASCSKKCALYEISGDDFWQLHNDVLYEDEKGSHVRESHICVMYDGFIPDGIFDGPKECPYFEDKAKDLQVGKAPRRKT
jgi:hypothetical protein